MSTQGTIKMKINDLAELLGKNQAQLKETLEKQDVIELNLKEKVIKTQTDLVEIKILG